MKCCLYCNYKKQRNEASSSEENNYHAMIWTYFFWVEELALKDMHYTSESVWKRDKHSTSGKPFYSSIYWKIVAHNNFKFEGSCAKFDWKTRNGLFVSCLELCINFAWKVECEYDCNCGEVCGIKRITRKKVKDATVINVK